jgi:ubiquinone/menaquinone biosynthesis C-methylase UbiE
VKCDVGNGIPVEDGSMDVVYSSHLIEDFADTAKIISEFLRILKLGGTMILVFPDQQKYEKCCEIRREQPNQSHRHPDFGLKFVSAVLKKLKCIKGGSYWQKEVGEYNCIIKFRKK